MRLGCLVYAFWAESVSYSVSAFVSVSVSVCVCARVRVLKTAIQKIEHENSLRELHEQEAQEERSKEQEGAG